MKNIITYRLVPFEKAVAFQVLEMDESQRSGKTSLPFKSYSGLEIISNRSPELQENAVYLRGGSPNRDLYVATREFSSNEERDTYIAKVHEALREWAANGGFHGTKKPATIVTDEFTYSLEMK